MILTRYGYKSMMGQYGLCGGHVQIVAPGHHMLSEVTRVCYMSVKILRKDILLMVQKRVMFS
jgi:hypothetical protein